MKKIAPYWGWFLLLFVIVGWFSSDIGPMALVVASVGASLYFLFAAPLWCGARTRAEEFCRNNSRGLLVGCHLRNHKWQSMKMLIHVSRWRELGAKMLSGLGRQAATISALAGVVSAIVATVTLAVT